jgi:predicted nucleic acid-binding protein
MPDRAVLDSSILAAMFFKEAASSRALKCAAECDPVTLDLAVAEVGNVAWKQVVFSGESKDRALDAFRDCQDFITTACTLIKASDLTAEAFEIAVENKTSYYDSLFLAAAQEEKCHCLPWIENCMRK